MCDFHLESCFFLEHGVFKSLLAALKEGLCCIFVFKKILT